MIDDLGPGFVLATACITAGLTIFYYLKANHTERMARIARNLPDEGGDRRRRSFLEIKFGMLFAGLGIGLLLALGAEKTIAFNEGSIIYPAFMFICGGFSLLASYFLIDRLQRKD